MCQLCGKRVEDNISNICKEETGYLHNQGLEFMTGAREDCCSCQKNRGVKQELTHRQDAVTIDEDRLITFTSAKGREILENLVFFLWVG